MTRPDRESWTEQPLDWLATHDQSDRLIASVERSALRRRKLRWCVGGASLALTGIFLLSVTRWSPPSHPRAAATATVMRPERMELPDGSVVELKPGAAVDIRFSTPGTGEREVWLTRGTAHFQVAPDRSRPFVVRVDPVAFRAVGTAFAVDREGSDLGLVVTEGKVAVQAGMQKDDVAIADAGEGLTVGFSSGERPEVKRVSASDAAAWLSWRAPRLVLNETPLREVALLLGRHAALTIRVADEIAEIPISGVMPADTPEPLFNLLRRNYGLRVEQMREGDFSIGRAPK